MQVERCAGLESHRVRAAQFAELNGDVVRAGRQRHVCQRPCVVDGVHSETLQIVDAQAESSPRVVGRQFAIQSAQTAQWELEGPTTGAGIAFRVDHKVSGGERWGGWNEVSVQASTSWASRDGTG
jgi:hypothetical protein